jgi:hypothetical protein
MFINPLTGRKVKVGSRLGKQLIQQFGGELSILPTCNSTTDPIKCATSKDSSGRRCAFRKAPNQEHGLCAATKDGTDIEGTLDRARVRGPLRQQYEKSAGERFLKAFRARPGTKCLPYEGDMDGWEVCTTKKDEKFYHQRASGASRWIEPDWPFCRTIAVGLDECVHPKDITNTPEDRTVYFYDTSDKEGASKDGTWEYKDYKPYYNQRRSKERPSSD